MLGYHHLGSWDCHHYSRLSRLEASVSALNYLALKTAGSTGTTKDGGWATWHVVSDAICSCSLVHGLAGSLHREKVSAVGDQIAQANLVCYIEAFTLSRVLNGLSNETGCAEVTVYTNAKVIEATEEILGV